MFTHCHGECSVLGYQSLEVICSHIATVSVLHWAINDRWKFVHIGKSIVMVSVVYFDMAGGKGVLHCHLFARCHGKCCVF